MSRRLDPVTLEVIRNALPAVSNEMSADLQRTSYNMMIYEVRDYCTALLDVEGELISQNLGGVSHFVADLGVVIEDGWSDTATTASRPATCSSPTIRRSPASTSTIRASIFRSSSRGS